MDLRTEVCDASPTSLEEYASVPIRFEVKSVFEISHSAKGPHEFLLSERKLDVPYTKDYDVLEDPLKWAGRFDVSTSRLFKVRANGQCVGCAAITVSSSHINSGLSDTIALLCDIRVRPEFRGRGIGFALFRTAETWAISQGSRQLRVETQNINVPACRFYAQQGCVLAEVNPGAYPELPEEVQMIWTKQLSP